MALAIVLVGADCPVADYLVAAVERRPEPLLEGANLELPGAPASPWAREEGLVLPQPEIEIAVGVKPLDGLAKKAFEPAKIRVELGKLLSGVGKVALELDVRVGLRPMNGERRERSIVEEADCSRILQLAAATRGAMSGLMEELVADHVREHVARADVAPDVRAEAAEELIAIISRYSK